MSAKFSVRLSSEIANHWLPPKLLLAQDSTESVEHVLLKLLAFVLFQRERLQIEPRLHDDNLPFIPDLVQLDYELRPALWIECGATPATRLNKLAVKAPLAELWVVLRSAEEIESLMGEMQRHDLRRNRYHLLGFEAAVFDELLSLFAVRNELALYRIDFPNHLLQIYFNGVWFEGEFQIKKF